MADMKGTDVDDDAAERFELVFIYMGQGDCTLIRCPDGQVVVVDCGSKAYLEDEPFVRAQLLLRSKAWAGTEKKVHSLILTHPDRDHYNRLGEFFWGTKFKEPFDIDGKSYSTIEPPIGVERVYLSQSYRDDSPMGNYSENSANHWIYANRLDTAAIYEVTINDTKDELKQWRREDGFKKAGTTPIAGSKQVVLSGRTKNGKDWEIAIIAGNVPINQKTGLKDENGNALTEPKDAANAASLVTRLSIDRSVALIVGDATFSTERFLMDKHPDAIKEVAIAQVGHHGSSDTSSSPAYVKLVDPARAAVSVGYNESSHRLPRYKALERWLELLDERDKGAEHHIDYWQTAEEAGTTWEEQLEVWKNDPEDSKILEKWGDKFSYRLSDPGDGRIYAFSGNMFLFRESTRLQLEQTSMGTFRWTLP